MDRLCIKEVLVGRQRSGKTTLAKTFTTKRFPPPSYKCGIGADFDCVDIVVSPNRNATLQIWDTAGQERFQSIGVSFYRGSDIALVCFDSCSEESFSEVEKWIEEVKLYSDSDVLIYIVATKIDKKERIITPKEGQALAKTLNVPYKEVSCKNYDSVKDLFTDVTIAAYQRLPQKDLKKFQKEATTPNRSSMPMFLLAIGLAFALWKYVIE